jgi:putative ubiquitin-RnfH superfamily antitoxin RatB of RatAB toxin-antitoxin module
MNAKGPSDTIRVEVVLAMTERQVLVELSVAPGSTVADAITQSGIQEKFQGFQIDLGMVGVFGQKTPPEQVLREGDRVEIYRPLLADPKESRRQRAARQNNKEPAR